MSDYIPGCDIVTNFNSKTIITRFSDSGEPAIFFPISKGFAYVSYAICQTNGGHFITSLHSTQKTQIEMNNAADFFFVLHTCFLCHKTTLTETTLTKFQTKHILDSKATNCILSSCQKV